MNLKPHIIGLTKIRNEQSIINDTLNRWAGLCTGGIIVLDEKSDDNTVQICKENPVVKDILSVEVWNPEREKAEWMNRQKLLDRGRQLASVDTWFVYFDADEHLYAFDDFGMFENPDIKAIACRLFDFYITPNDVDFHYKDRKWIGPEFRTIIMFFKNQTGLRYHLPDQRIVTLPEGIGTIPIHGDIKHYGKGFSVEAWEKTCEYYIKFWPKYADKWRQRVGKAVHKDMLSDFGNPLIMWRDRNDNTLIPMEQQNYGKK